MSVPLPVERVVALDAEFGPMAVAAGGYATELPGLTIREKCFTWIADDVCSGHLGLPFALHLQVARAAGTTWGELRAVLRHLAPYAGYPAVVEAFARLVEHQGGEPEGSPEQVVTGHPPEAPSADAEFEAWVADQEVVRWGASPLTARERALLCLAVDVLHQTLGAPMRVHVHAALAAGAKPDTLRALLRLMAELAMSKVWQAFDALEGHLRSTPAK